MPQQYSEFGPIGIPKLNHARVTTASPLSHLSIPKPLTPPSQDFQVFLENPGALRKERKQKITDSIYMDAIST
jgi:hypothetical protein